MLDIMLFMLAKTAYYNEDTHGRLCGEMAWEYAKKRGPQKRSKKTEFSEKHQEKASVIGS